MASRLELHALLKQLVPNVYFQPPETVKLVYPCIVYSENSLKIDYANNMPYNFTKSYEISYITKNPDANFEKQILKKFSLINFSRHFVSENLYHDCYTLYY